MVSNLCWGIPLWTRCSLHCSGEDIPETMTFMRFIKNNLPSDTSDANLRASSTLSLRNTHTNTHNYNKDMKHFSKLQFYISSNSPPLYSIPALTNIVSYSMVQVNWLLPKIKVTIKYVYSTMVYLIRCWNNIRVKISSVRAEATSEEKNTLLFSSARASPHTSLAQGFSLSLPEPDTISICTGHDSHCSR